MIYNAPRLGTSYDNVHWVGCLMYLSEPKRRSGREPRHLANAGGKFGGVWCDSPRGPPRSPRILSHHQNAKTAQAVYAIGAETRQIIQY